MVTEKMIEAFGQAFWPCNAATHIAVERDNIHAALSAALSTDAGPVKVGRFGHHPEPAVDFCIEVEALEGHLFDARHGIGKPGHEPRKIDDDFLRRVSKAMEFIVGGDQIAIAAKATLRALSAQVQDVAIPEGWQLVPVEPTGEMLTRGKGSGSESLSEYGVLEVWNDMLAAAPAAKLGDGE